MICPSCNRPVITSEKSPLAALVERVCAVSATVPYPFHICLEVAHRLPDCWEEVLRIAAKVGMPATVYADVVETARIHEQLDELDRLEEKTNE